MERGGIYARSFTSRRSRSGEDGEEEANKSQRRSPTNSSVTAVDGVEEYLKRRRRSVGNISRTVSPLSPNGSGGNYKNNF